MGRAERIKEIIKENPDFGKGVGYKMCVVDELHDMTEEKLKQEVEEYLSRQTLPKIDNLVYRVIKNLILGFAECAAEKVKELEAQNQNLIIMLQAEREVRVKEEYLKKITELEVQIENMKCCGNCKFMFCDEQDKKDCGYNYKNWEMR